MWALNGEWVSNYSNELKAKGPALSAGPFCCHYFILSSFQRKKAGFSRTSAIRS
jgi:hypothetical protein